MSESPSIPGLAAVEAALGAIVAWRSHPDGCPELRLERANLVDIRWTRGEPQRLALRFRDGADSQAFEVRIGPFRGQVPLECHGLDTDGELVLVDRANHGWETRWQLTTTEDDLSIYFNEIAINLVA